MPRIEKNCFDWSLTWSPENDVSELPKFLDDFMHSKDITRCVCITERHGAEEKWHIHIGFTYYRSYKSDYKWWKKPFEEAGFKEPAIEIKYHNNIFGLIGGYLGKSVESDVKQLFSKGFSNDEVEFGKEEYNKGLRRQKLRKFLDPLLIINRDKFEAAVGATMREHGCNESEAEIILADDGWCYATSKRGNKDVYGDMYREKEFRGLLR